MSWTTTASLNNKTIDISFVRDLQPVVVHYIHRPIIILYISRVILLIPLYDYTSEIDKLNDGIDKEVGCALSEDIDQQLDYRCLFPSKGVERWALHDWLPERKDLSLSLQRALEQWR
jgi:hypothetical protein